MRLVVAKMSFSSRFSIRFGGTLGCHWQNPEVMRNPGWKTLM